MTCGSQKWRGAAPIFKASAKRINGLELSKKFNGFKKNGVMEAKINVTEAIAWLRKYLILDSVD